MKIDRKISISLIFLSIFFSSITAANEIAPFEGRLAPDFTLKQQAGAEFKLSDYRGKQAVYVVFWNTWCRFCMRKIPKLKEAEVNLSKQLKIIAINTSREDSLELMKQFQQQYQINYSLVFDDGSKISDLYRVKGVPTEFIVDINGIIKHRDGVPKQLRQSLSLWNTPLNNQCKDTQLVC